MLTLVRKLIELEFECYIKLYLKFQKRVFVIFGSNHNETFEKYLVHPQKKLPKV